MITSVTGKTWTIPITANFTLKSNANLSVKSALFAAVGFVSCRNMTNATHALNESNEEETIDPFDSEDDSSPDVQPDPTQDDWIDREDFYDDGE